MNHNIRKYIFTGMLAICAPALMAVTLDEAKALYLKGRYAEALPAFRTALKSKPKDPSLNHWTGVCLYKTGDPAQGKPLIEFAMTKNILEAPRYLAEIAFDEYRPADAEEYLERYRAAMKKAKKSVPADVEAFSDRVGRMSAMMGRVENIVIIDSLAVDKAEFFQSYRLSPESGAFYSSATLPDGFPSADTTVVYMPQSQSSMMWAAPDDTGRTHLLESAMLTDGSWEAPHSLGDAVNEGGDANFPFLMSDGITLYYANNGENSLGGYDIFITRRDDTEFLSPQNIGMPYNSPYDDYLLAIDEVTGVGWWATDRNQLGDKITIYRFIPSDLRINYDPDDRNIARNAKVVSYRDTWPDGADYTALLEQIDAIEPAGHEHQPDFVFPLPDGRVYTGWEDFRTGRGRELMEQYVDTDHADSEDRAELESLRRRYADGDTSVAQRILVLEKKIMTTRASQRRIANEIIRIER
ncbi:MAG: tetratricopeptide repeat protein [Muribaculaceae bacterium]|nr:tetratricopeptide repeat protein [Muribaculaceae bacterium]